MELKALFVFLFVGSGIFVSCQDGLDNTKSSSDAELKDLLNTNPSRSPATNEVPQELKKDARVKVEGCAPVVKQVKETCCCPVPTPTSTASVIPVVTSIQTVATSATIYEDEPVDDAEYEEDLPISSTTKTTKNSALVSSSQVPGVMIASLFGLALYLI